MGRDCNKHDAAWELSIEQRPILTFKKTSTSAPAAKNVDPVKIKEELITTDRASEESKLLALSIKRRRYVKPATDKDCVPVKEEQVERVAIKKPHQAEVMSTEESVGKKKRQETEQQEFQTKNVEPLTKMMHEPRQLKTWLGVPGTDDFPSTKSISDPSYWLRILQKNVYQLEDSKILRDIEFTEEQEEILQESFMHICRKMSHITKNSDRFMKIYKCLQCEFSVSHQCVSLDRIRHRPFGLQLIGPSTLIPERTTICMCGFAFFHDHVKRLRPPGPTVTPRFSPYLREYNRSINVSCAKCYTNIVMSNRTSNVCCDLINWDTKNDYERDRFYTSVLRHLHYESTNNLDEFYGCSKGCCLLFHRCSSNTGIPCIGGTSPG